MTYTFVHFPFKNVLYFSSVTPERPEHIYSVYFMPLFALSLFRHILTFYYLSQAFLLDNSESSCIIIYVVLKILHASKCFLIEFSNKSK